MERALLRDLREALKNLSVSQKRVKAVADLALMNSRDYKEIVLEIERHISKTSAEKRLAGIYVVDAIIRGVRLSVLFFLMLQKCLAALYALRCA